MVIPFIIFTGVWGSTWIVIRDQLGVVAPQWSVTYRFTVAAIGMALLATFKGQSLKLDRGGLIAALILGVTQFCVNFNSVYLAERFITSGVIATAFALLLIPNSILAWAFLGQKPSGRFLLAGLTAIIGVGLLFLHELRSNTSEASQIAIGLGLTLVGIMGASCANVYQAGKEAMRHPLLALLAPALLATELALMPAAIAGGWARQKLRSYLELVRWLPRLLRERRRIQATRAIPVAEFASMLTAELDSPFIPAPARSRPVRALSRLYWRLVRSLLARGR